MTPNDETTLSLIMTAAAKVGYPVRRAAEGFISVQHAPMKVCRLIEGIHAGVVEELERRDAVLAIRNGSLVETGRKLAEAEEQRDALLRERDEARAERDQARADAEADNAEAIRARAERDEALTDVAERDAVTREALDVFVPWQGDADDDDLPGAARAVIAGFEAALAASASARAEERAACALICEQTMEVCRHDTTDPDADSGYVAAQVCLDGIRAREVAP